MTNILRRPAVLSGVAVMNLRVLTLGSRFFLSLILARFLSASDLGSYGLLTAVLAFALFIVGLEFYSYTLRRLATVGSRRKVFIIADQIVLAGVMLSLAALLAVLSAALELLPWAVVPWLLVILVTEHISVEGTRILIILSRPVRAYIGLFIRGGVWVAVVFFIMLTDMSARRLETVLLWWALGGVACTVLTVWSLKHLPWGVLRVYRPDWNSIRGGLRVARPFMITAFSALTLSYVDRFLIEAYLGRSTLGVYTFFSMLVIGILSFGTSVSHQFLPKVIASYKTDAGAFHRVMRVYALSLGAVGGGVVLIAGVAIWPALVLLELTHFSTGLPAFYIMLVAALIRIMADIPSYALYAAHSDKVLLWCNLAAAAVAVIVNTLLVKPFGLVGAACASLLASSVLFLALGYFAWSARRPVTPAAV